MAAQAETLHFIVRLSAWPTWRTNILLNRLWNTSKTLHHSTVYMASSPSIVFWIVMVSKLSHESMDPGSNPSLDGQQPVCSAVHTPLLGWSISKYLGKLGEGTLWACSPIMCSLFFEEQQITMPFVSLTKPNYWVTNMDSLELIDGYQVCVQPIWLFQVSQHFVNHQAPRKMINKLTGWSLVSKLLKGLLLPARIL